MVTYKVAASSASACPTSEHKDCKNKQTNKQTNKKETISQILALTPSRETWTELKL